MTTLTDAVHELTRDHLTRTADGRVVQEMSLLAQLREQFTANRGTGAGAAGAKGLISFNALNLWNEITDVVNAEWAGAGRPALARTPLPERIQHWAEHTPNQLAAHAHVTRWCKLIRAMDESRAEVIGRCPECGEAEVVTVEDGEQTFHAAVTRVEGKAYASCAHCLRDWEGVDAMRELAAHIGEI